MGLAIAAVYPELQTMAGAYGCFNRRRIAGSLKYSLHAEGRAVDVGVEPPELELGWVLAHDLVDQRGIYGTMRVMFDRHIWTTERGDQWRRLGRSTNQHLDHIHVEQFWNAAKRPPTVQSEMESALRRGRDGG